MVPQVGLRILQSVPVSRCYLLCFFLRRYYLRPTRRALADATTVAAFLQGRHQARRDAHGKPVGWMDEWEGREEGRVSREELPVGKGLPEGTTVLAFLVGGD